MTSDEMTKKNHRMFLIVIGVVFAMVALSFVTPQLYNLFCRVTGYGGTTQRVDEETKAKDQEVERAVLDRVVTIRFDANISKKLPWDFGPTEKTIEVKIGEDTLATYYAKSNSSVETSGTALFNVTPLKAGKYFSKIECFCFSDQTLKAGERVEMPVNFYIDPSMAEDQAMDDVDTVTLSYSFMPTEKDE